MICPICKKPTIQKEMSLSLSEDPIVLKADLYTCYCPLYNLSEMDFLVDHKITLDNFTEDDKGKLEAQFRMKKAWIDSYMKRTGLETVDMGRTEFEKAKDADANIIKTESLLLSIEEAKRINRVIWAILYQHLTK